MECLNIYGKYYDQKRHQNKSSGHKNENNNNENHLNNFIFVF